MFLLYYLNWFMFFIAYSGIMICLINEHNIFIFLYFVLQMFTNIINLNFKIRRYRVILTKIMIFINIFLFKCGIIFLFLVPYNNGFDIIIFDLIFINVLIYIAMVYEYYYTKIIYYLIINYFDIINIIILI